MIDPERERIEALIKRLKILSLPSDPVLAETIHDAIAQLRVDHPAQGEPAATVGIKSDAAVDRSYRNGFLQACREWSAHLEGISPTFSPPALNLARKTMTKRCIAVNECYRRDLHSHDAPMPPPVAPAQTEATPAEQGGGGATAAASRPSFAAQAEAVGRVAQIGWVVPIDPTSALLMPLSQIKTFPDPAALSAAAATLAAVPAMVEALQPFADIADAIDTASAPRLREDESAIWGAGLPMPRSHDLTMRKLRAARAALRRLGGEDRG